MNRPRFFVSTPSRSASGRFAVLGLSLLLAFQVVFGAEGKELDDGWYDACLVKGVFGYHGAVDMISVSAGLRHPLGLGVGVGMGGVMPSWSDTVAFPRGAGYFAPKLQLLWMPWIVWLKEENTPARGVDRKSVV